MKASLGAETGGRRAEQAQRPGGRERMPGPAEGACDQSMGGPCRPPLSQGLRILGSHWGGPACCAGAGPSVAAPSACPRRVLWGEAWPARPAGEEAAGLQSNFLSSQTLEALPRCPPAGRTSTHGSACLVSHQITRSCCQELYGVRCAAPPVSRSSRGAVLCMCLAAHQGHYVHSVGFWQCRKIK